MKHVYIPAALAAVLALGWFALEDAQNSTAGDFPVYADQEAAPAAEAGFYGEDEEYDEEEVFGVLAQSVGEEPVVSEVPPRTAAGSQLREYSGDVELVRAAVVDRAGFERPLTAATLLVPSGWQTQGGVVWELNTSGCGKNNPHFNWAAVAPDGVGMVSLLPSETWTGTNLPYASANCPNVRTTDVREIVLSYIQRYRPGARLLEYNDRPDIAEKYRKELPPPPPSGYGSEIRSWTGAGMARVSYEVQGRPVEEYVGAAILFMSLRSAGVMPGQTMEQLTVSVLGGFGVRMPQGRLDMKLVEAIRRSGEPNGEWSARMAQHHSKIASINAKGAAQRSKIISQTNNEISQMRQDSWKRQQESQDRMHREFSEAIRGVETYDDPYNGGTVELDNTYDQAWQLNNGDYVLTNDPSFNPYASTGQDGQQLQPTR